MHEIEMAPHDCERRPKLVGSVCGEPALLSEGVFQTIKHGVERLHELADVVGRPCVLDPPSE